MPIQGIQMRNQVILNVASVILKGIKTNEISENLPSLFRSTSKKRKKEGNKCKWLGKKTTKKMQNLLEKTYLKLTMSSFR